MHRESRWSETFNHQPTAQEVEDFIHLVPKEAVIFLHGHGGNGRRLEALLIEGKLETFDKPTVKRRP